VWGGFLEPGAVELWGGALRGGALKRGLLYFLPFDLPTLESRFNYFKVYIQNIYLIFIFLFFFVICMVDTYFNKFCLPFVFLQRWYELKKNVKIFCFDTER
jgi:hypothetical protein